MRLHAIVIPAFVALAALSGCAQSVDQRFGYTHYKSGLPKVLSDGRFEVAVSALDSGAHAKDYFATVTVRNTGKDKAVFDSGAFKLLDPASGISYHSVSKDKEAVTLPAELSHVITRKALEPGDKVSGALWFSTGLGEAKAASLELGFGGTSVGIKP